MELLLILMLDAALPAGGLRRLEPLGRVPGALLHPHLSSESWRRTLVTTRDSFSDTVHRPAAKVSSAGRSCPEFPQEVSRPRSERCLGTVQSARERKRFLATK